MARALLASAGLLFRLTYAQEGQWVLTFEDDFAGSSLNASSWTPKNYSTQDGGYALFVPQSVSVASGNLVITTSLVPGGGVFGGKPYNFTSGWVDSQNKVFQRNGRFEASMKLPPNEATCSWPAWWLLPNPEALCWPIGGEVDILESYSGSHPQHNNPKLPYQTSSTYHWGYQCYQDAWRYPEDCTWYPNASDPNSPVIDFSASYHVFGVEINDTALRWYVDNTTTMTVVPPMQSGPNFTWGVTAYAPFSELFGILNVAVATNGPSCFSDWWSSNNGTLLVDWVRIWQWKPACPASGA